jgi:hypothetical protein
MTRAALRIACSAHRTGSAPLSRSEVELPYLTSTNVHTRNCALALQICDMAEQNVLCDCLSQAPVYVSRKY